MGVISFWEAEDADCTKLRDASKVSIERTIVSSCLGAGSQEIFLSLVWHFQCMEDHEADHSFKE